MKNKNVVAYCRTAWEPERGPSAARSQTRAIRGYAERRSAIAEHEEATVRSNPKPS
jgi:hypothetical protein